MGNATHYILVSFLFLQDEKIGKLEDLPNFDIMCNSVKALKLMGSCRSKTDSYSLHTDMIF